MAETETSIRPCMLLKGRMIETLFDNVSYYASLFWISICAKLYYSVVIPFSTVVLTFRASDFCFL